MDKLLLNLRNTFSRLEDAQLEVMMIEEDIEKYRQLDYQLYSELEDLQRKHIQSIEALNNIKKEYNNRYNKFLDVFI